MEWVTVSYNGKKRSAANHPTHQTHTAQHDIKLAGIFLVSKDANDRIVIGLINNAAKKKWLINNMGITLTSILEEFGSRLENNETHLDGMSRILKEVSLGLLDISSVSENLPLHHKSKMMSGIVFIDYNDMITFQQNYSEKISTVDKSTIPKYCGDMDSIHFVYLDTINDNLKRVEIYSGQKYSEKYCLTTDINGNNIWISYRTHGFLVDNAFLEKIYNVVSNDTAVIKL
jgi:hypothetical protein